MIHSLPVDGYEHRCISNVLTLRNIGQLTFCGVVNTAFRVGNTEESRDQLSLV